MIDLNISNFVTVGLISVASYALLKFLLEKFGVNLSWL